VSFPAISLIPEAGLSFLSENSQEEKGESPHLVRSYQLILMIQPILRQSLLKFGGAFIAFAINSFRLLVLKSPFFKGGLSKEFR
jgi:hypothetical protein